MSDTCYPSKLHELEHRIEILERKCFPEKNIDKTFAKLLREVRASLRLSTRSMGEKLGVSAATIFRVESEQVNASQKTVKALYSFIENGVDKINIYY